MPRERNGSLAMQLLRSTSSLTTLFTTRQQCPFFIYKHIAVRLPLIAFAEGSTCEYGGEPRQDGEQYASLGGSLTPQVRR